MSESKNNIFNKAYPVEMECRDCKLVKPLEKFYVVNAAGNRRRTCNSCTTDKANQKLKAKRVGSLECILCGRWHRPTKHDAGYCLRCRREKGWVKPQ